MPDSWPLMFDEIQDIQQVPHVGAILGADPVVWQWNGGRRLSWTQVETRCMGHELTTGAARPVGTTLWMTHDAGALAYLRWSWMCAVDGEAIECDAWSIETNLRLRDESGVSLPTAHARYVLARLICELGWQRLVVETLKN